MRKSLILTTVFLSIFTLYMSRSADAANWSGKVKIASIEVSNIGSPGVWLTFSSAPYASHNCPSKNGQYMLGGGDNNITEMTKIATVALIKRKAPFVYD